MDPIRMANNCQFYGRYHHLGFSGVNKMKHILEPKGILWTFSISLNKSLCIEANGKTAILISPDGRVTICNTGTDIGLKYRGQIIDGELIS
jgi:hypothetical protein